jgi:hypothetical protein
MLGFMDEEASTGPPSVEQAAHGDPVAVLGGLDQRRRVLRRGRSDARGE